MEENSEKSTHVFLVFLERTFVWTCKGPSKLVKLGRSKQFLCGGYNRNFLFQLKVDGASLYFQRAS